MTSWAQGDRFSLTDLELSDFEYFEFSSPAIVRLLLYVRTKHSSDLKGDTPDVISPIEMVRCCALFCQFIHSCLIRLRLLRQSCDHKPKGLNIQAFVVAVTTLSKWSPAVQIMCPHHMGMGMTHCTISAKPLVALNCNPFRSVHSFSLSTPTRSQPLGMNQTPARIDHRMIKK